MISELDFREFPLARKHTYGTIPFKRIDRLELLFAHPVFPEDFERYGRSTSNDSTVFTRFPELPQEVLADHCAAAHCRKAPQFVSAIDGKSYFSVRCQRRNNPQ